MHGGAGIPRPIAVSGLASGLFRVDPACPDRANGNHEVICPEIDFTELFFWLSPLAESHSTYCEAYSVIRQHGRSVPGASFPKGLACGDHGKLFSCP